LKKFNKGKKGLIEENMKREIHRGIPYGWAKKFQSRTRGVGEN